MNKCFVMLKPGVVNRRIVGEIITRLERKGLRLIGIKMIKMSEDMAKSHYQEHAERSFFKDLTDYITSGPVIAMVWKGDNCVQFVRKLVGATRVEDALPGTIRGDYCLHTPHNIIHASDSDASADREIQLFFKECEIYDWTNELQQWY